MRRAYHARANRAERTDGDHGGLAFRPPILGAPPNPILTEGDHISWCWSVLAPDLGPS